MKFTQSCRTTEPRATKIAPPHILTKSYVVRVRQSVHSYVRARSSSRRVSRRDIYTRALCTYCTHIVRTRYVYYPWRGGQAGGRGRTERSLGKLVAAALPLIYGNRRDSYGKVTVERSIKRRAACPRESATAARRIVNRGIATAQACLKKNKEPTEWTPKLSRTGDSLVPRTYSADRTISVSFRVSQEPRPTCADADKRFTRNSQGQFEIFYVFFLVVICDMNTYVFMSEFSRFLEEIYGSFYVNGQNVSHTNGRRTFVLG